MEADQPLYKRLATLNIPLVVTAMREHVDIIINGLFIKVAPVRVQTFLKGTSCVACGKKAAFFAIEAMKPDYCYWHLNLYGVDEATGQEFMMTSDHIIPKSLGGSGKLDNRQPMCQQCNSRKGNSLETSACRVA